MPTAAPVRTVKVSETDETYDAYTTLVAAIVARAVQDAQGETFAPGPVAPGRIQTEAVAWLADEAAVRDLIELCGVNATPVVRRLQILLHEAVPLAAAPQLPLF